MTSIGELPRVREALAARSLVVERELGHGGMSTVYLARDLRHGRLVAVKVLRPDVPLGAERFLQEIKLASPLSHPHIVPVYDSGTVEGAPFYVMPYVDGDSLRERLNKEERLEIGEAVRLAGEVAEALEFAHERGIIHRDVKPENILLQAGHALVVDFGVARALHHAGMAGPVPTRLTTPGFALGTAEYMSPEQASGEETVDPRSDIYSLGCVLYEMLAGKPPFTGKSPREILAGRFRGPPRPLRELRPEVPPALEQVVDRALAPDPADRYQSAREFLDALHRATFGIITPPRSSISRGRRHPTRSLVAAVAAAAVAVLAFQAEARKTFDPRRVAVARMSNETGDTTLSYLGQLATDRMTAALASSRGLRVITSATILPSRVNPGLQDDSLDDPARLRTLAVETAAGTLISGSYFRDDGRLSFQAEITDANHGALLKAIGPITAPLDRADDAVDSLARTVARSLRAVSLRD